MGRPRKIVVPGDETLQKKRVSKKEEDLKQLKLTPYTEAELQEKLKETLVDFDLNNILVSLNNLAESIKPEETLTPEQIKIIKADIKVHHTKIYQVYGHIMSLISESVLAGADRLPSNIYNLQDALEDLAYGLDTNNFAVLYMACKNFKGNIDRPGGRPRYYSETDLQAVREKAEEVGYQKGLKAAQGGQHFDHIDLLD